MISSNIYLHQEAASEKHTKMDGKVVPNLEYTLKEIDIEHLTIPGIAPQETPTWAQQ